MTPEQKERAKKVAGEIILDGIQEYLDEGKSPVKKESFPKLSKAYADAEKGGDTTPDLFLSGDMREEIEVKNHADGVKVGVFKDSPEAKKASWHNLVNKRTKNKIKRRFIPDPSQEFKKPIMDEVKDALKDIRQEGSTISTAAEIFEQSLFGISEAQEPDEDGIESAFSGLSISALRDIFLG